MTDTPTSTAVAQIDNSPKAMVARYSESFAAVLPRTVISNPEAWIRIAQGALKKGKRLPSGETELERAAMNNPGVFLAALLDAARMGLEPGTEEYYLTPRKVKGQLEILGITGYQGIVTMMYRAGFVSSVVVEVVREKDHFSYSPGRMEIPDHEIDWDLDDRGRLRLVYAYARMKGGGFSKVVVLNRGDIQRIKSKSQGASSEYSPWQTNEEAMWLKSAARSLRKWVPTSSEQRGVVQAVAGPPLEAVAAPVLAGEPNADLPPIPEAPSEFEDDDDIIDAELVPDDDDGGAPESASADPMNEGQSKALTALLRSQGVVGPERFDLLSSKLGREVTAMKDITAAEAATLITELQDGAAADDAA